MTNDKLAGMLKGISSICARSQYSEEQLGHESKKLLLDTCNKCFELVEERDTSVNIFFEKLTEDVSIEVLSTTASLMLSFLRSADFPSVQQSAYDNGVISN